MGGTVHHVIVGEEEFQQEEEGEWVSKDFGVVGKVREAGHSFKGGKAKKGVEKKSFQKWAHLVISRKEKELEENEYAEFLGG